MSLSVDNVLNALRLIIEPDLKKDIVSLEMVRDLEIHDTSVSFNLLLPTPNCPYKDSLKRACTRSIHDNVDPKLQVNISLHTRQSLESQNSKEPLSEVKHIIAVASGKGGVGKSTVSANLAIALAAKGFRVGLLDADIYGPSMPLMFDAESSELQSKEVHGKSKVLPLEKYGVFLASIGFFIDKSKALIWRAPMAISALKQLYTEVHWGELDYLIIDLPPGTGDIHLSLVQTLKLSGAVVVSTPQEVSLIDARKAVSMFENKNIQLKILGMIENMAWFTPKELPDNKYYIFGKDGCKKVAESLNIPFLGQIPLIQEVCQSGDNGKPAVLDVDNPAKPYFEIVAENIINQLNSL